MNMRVNEEIIGAFGVITFVVVMISLAVLGIYSDNQVKMREKQEVKKLYPELNNDQFNYFWRNGMIKPPNQQK